MNLCYSDLVECQLRVCVIHKNELNFHFERFKGF
ncbi:hypothetical protein V6Z12_D05G363900 [Gossypium hirsutum]